MLTGGHEYLAVVPDDVSLSFLLQCIRVKGACTRFDSFSSISKLPGSTMQLLLRYSYPSRRGYWHGRSWEELELVPMSRTHFEKQKIERLNLLPNSVMSRVHRDNILSQVQGPIRHLIGSHHGPQVRCCLEVLGGVGNGSQGQGIGVFAIIQWDWSHRGPYWVIGVFPGHFEG